MKILFLFVLLLAGALPICAQMRAPKAATAEKRIITATEIAAKKKSSPARKKRAGEADGSGQYFRAQRVIQTLGPVYLTPGEAFTFTAGDSIVLGPGFEVDSTTEFTAQIYALPAETAPAPELAATPSNALNAAADNTGNLQAFTLFPNPASEQFHIQYEVNKTAVVSVALYTLEGTPVQQFVTAQQQEPGSYKLALPVTQIASGVYVVALKIDSKTISQRVVIR
ncbi:T9SS type A sorting domain-containing protein [Adhaeribacter swui]|uniref:T9SS type A sorting domain-containing protein n=1 Tax=Adhaeribacter swui TaxID=2086471 RepID=A0A7G7G9P0_9BACT|nr:T9SS type A sorting domain-containing protein [Adhaeribacter swui]QNF33874.1 T9SS type A sorting domain-containing protein [Adhaeribacter swui]